MGQVTDLLVGRHPRILPGTRRTAEPLLARPSVGLRRALVFHRRTRVHLSALVWQTGFPKAVGGCRGRQEVGLMGITLTLFGEPQIVRNLREVRSAIDVGR
jgi:hypothetical protein